jgi:hypothetical protein
MLKVYLDINAARSAKDSTEVYFVAAKVHLELQLSATASAVRYERAGRRGAQLSKANQLIL